ncbi:MAG: arginine--tRNA ligase [Verrucomicrobia bacterium]|nr:arginine--tRNA ligase [Verrucomicrobiota bacterium]
METPLATFQRTVADAIQRAFSLPRDESTADMAPCAQEEFGHYQCNSALRLSKLLKKNPRQVAEQIISHLDDATKSRCSKIEIAGPGFINFTLTPRHLSFELNHQLNDPRLGAMKPLKKQKIVVEFSSPNIAKELHVGHIRSTIIGDCLARLFEFLGHDVLRLNHIGDWGTQFGMLITYMREVAPEVLKGHEKTDLSTLMGWYRAAKKKFDEDPEFKKRAQRQVVELQSGNAEAMHAWKLICDVSRRGFQDIYDLLDTKTTERGESFYNPYLAEVVTEFDKKGLITISDGAKCIFLEGYANREGEPLPLMIQKADGGFNYDTTDLAALRHRIFVEKADRLIYVVDAGQSLHFQMVFAAGEKIGWYDSSKLKVEHVPFGLVLGADGKKFKTRSGETEKLIDLLTGAVDKAREILIERLPTASVEEIEELAKVIGIDAVKYSDLSTHRIKDYTFSYDRMLKFEGNTAVFLLYAYVRINGIKRKTHANMDHVLAQHQIDLNHPTEVTLGLHLRRFGEILEYFSRDLLPNRLCEYLYELAEKFNGFFRDCRVEGTQEEGSRLVLCELTARIMRQGLEILGLETVERL